MVINRVISLSNGISVSLELQNARVLRINPINKDVEKLNSNGDIIGLDYGENVKYSINDEYLIDKAKYKVQKITKIEDPDLGIGYILFNHIINKSSIFIMPLLAINGEIRTNFRWNTNFCNCFIGTEEDADYGEYIYLLYRFEGTKEFSSYENYLQKHIWFVGERQVDNYHTMYQFKPDKLFMNDFKLIVEGKYSSISEISKTRILGFHCVSRDKTLGKILYKDSSLKEEIENKLSSREHTVKIPENLDLHDIFYIDDEIYLNKYKIKKETKNESTNKDLFI